ncbi:MAG: thioredoxin domain-containing protein, partial [Acidimicrobiales bacterium]
RRTELVGQADQVSSAIGARTTVSGGKDGGGISASLLQGAHELLRSTYDAEWGGFGRSPKFPMPTNVELVLRTHARTGDEAAREMVVTTLDAMASGGMYDHLGGGFARYSVDTFWMVPHFEKMLYDQAGLARAYLHAWQVTAEPRYRHVVEETVGYVLAGLRQPEGGVCSAEDADSEGEEGKFYVWRHDEVLQVGGPDAVAWYGVTKGGNFEGSNILHRPERGALIRPPEVESARCRLFDARDQRVRPGLDDKVLTEWNAMFVSTLAEAAAAFGRSDWLASAETTGEFLLANLRRTDGRWMRSWQREGGARHLAYAVDYAWLVDAFTRLGEATGHAGWVAHARSTADALISLFADPDAAGFFTTGHDAEQLIVRQKDLYDGATPSANSVATHALLRLAALTGEQRYARAAHSLLQMLVDPMANHPGAFTNLIAAADLVLTGITEIAVAGERPDLARAVHERYLPNAVMAWGEPYDSPLWDARQDGLAYVCRDFACRAPVATVPELVAQLQV